MIGYGRPRVLNLDTPAGPVELDFTDAVRPVATAGLRDVPPVEVDDEPVALRLAFGYRPETGCFSLLAETEAVAWSSRDEGPPPRAWTGPASAVVEAVESFLSADRTAKVLAEIEHASRSSPQELPGRDRGRVSSEIALRRRSLFALVA